ncbi:MAG: type II secretion system protein GspG [Anaerovorax sp.]
MHSYQTALETTAMEHGGFKTAMVGADDSAKVAALGAAINSNLDKSLQVTVAGTAASPTVTPSADHKDPWGNAYVIAFAPATDTITVTSWGPDGKTGADDLVMTCLYNGTCKTTTTGFSVDMK